MKNREIIKLLLIKELEISNKIHNAIDEIFRLDYETQRGKDAVNDMIDSIEFSLEDLLRVIDRQ